MVAPSFSGLGWFITQRRHGTERGGQLQSGPGAERVGLQGSAMMQSACDCR